MRLLPFLALFGCPGPSPAPAEGPPGIGSEPAGSHCFTAIATLSEPSHSTLQAAGHEPNGEAWYAMFTAYAETHAGLGGAAYVPEALGDVRHATYEGRSTWIAMDPEAGGCLICTGDLALRDHLKATYDQAITDAAAVQSLIDAVPAGGWDD